MVKAKETLEENLGGLYISIRPPTQNRNPDSYEVSHIRNFLTDEKPHNRKVSHQ